MSEFVANIIAKLDAEQAEEKLKELTNKDYKIKLSVDNKMPLDQQIKKQTEQGLKATKTLSSQMSQQLADAFNIKDKSVISKIKSQINNMLSDLGNTWNGKQFDFSKSKGFINGMDGLAKTVTENANVIQSKLGIYDEFYKYFKDKKIYVSDALKDELGNNEYKDLLNNNNVGKIVRDATKGVSIDNIWGEMTQLFPEHFSDNIITQADQIKRAFEVLRAAREDMTTVIPAQNLSQEQLFGISESAYENIVPMANRLAESLQRNIQSATDGASNTFELNVDINTEKIVSDIRAAIQSATSELDDAIQINVKLNDEEVTSQLRTAITQISSGDEPVQVDIQVNKQSLQADLEATLQNLDLPIHFNIDVEELEADLRNAVNSITDIEVDLRVNTDGIRADADNAVNGGRDIQVPDVDTSGLGDLDRILGNINGAGVQGQSIFQALGGSFQEAFSTFTLANILQDSIYKVIDVGREAIGTVKELNDATVSLQMATGDSYGAVSKMMQDYNTLGKELGAVTVDVASGADSWLRQGKSIAETNTLIKDTMVLSKVSNLDSAASTDYLTSAMNGYKVAIEDVMGIVDKVSAIDLASATNAGGLMEAMSKVATTADMAGVSMDKLLAMLAATGEVTQASMSSIGNAYKTIFTRMSDIKAGKFKLIDEDGTTEI